MKNFKQLMYQYHEQNKMSLHHLYTDRQIYYSSISSSEQPIEDEKLFSYRAITFQFAGTGIRTPFCTCGFRRSFPCCRIAGYRKSVLFFTGPARTGFSGCLALP